MKTTTASPKAKKVINPDVLIKLEWIRRSTTTSKNVVLEFGDEGVRDEFYNDCLANESIVVQKEKYDVSTSSYVDDGARHSGGVLE